MFDPACHNRLPSCWHLVTMETSISPNAAIASVRGMGVAVIMRTSDCRLFPVNTPLPLHQNGAAIDDNQAQTSIIHPILNVVGSNQINQPHPLAIVSKTSLFSAAFKEPVKEPVLGLGRDSSNSQSVALQGFLLAP